MDLEQQIAGTRSFVKASHFGSDRLEEQGL